MLARTLKRIARSLRYDLAAWQSTVLQPVAWCGLLLCLAMVSASSTWAQAPRFAQQLPAPEQEPEELPEPEGTLPEQVKSMPGINADLEVVHRRSQVIVFKRKISRVHVTDPSVADYVLYSPAEMGVIGTAMGTTTILVWFEDDPDADPLIYLVTVIRDPGLEEAARIDYGKLEKKLHVLFPNSKVYLIPMSAKIIVKGQARDSEEATWIMQIVRGEIINQMGALAGPQNLGYANGGNFGGFGGTLAPGYGGNGFGNGRFNAYDWASNYIVDMLTIPGDFQVNLRVRIVELNRSQLKRMGVNLQGIIGNGRHIISSSLAGAASAGSTGAAGGLLNGVFEAGDISILINALRSNGTARILTEPNLTVLSGHDATVLSGGEFAVPTIVGIGGVGGQQTVFRGFGVSMLVTPTIVDKDLIRMRIRPEYSEIAPGNTSGGIPGLSTRRVDTTVELREGQTIVLAGLLSYRARTQVAGIPFLGGLPLIGPLVFQAKQSNEDETELLIMVTPEIVRPMEADEVPPVPGFEVTQPNDWDLYRYARTQGTNDTSVYQLAPYGHGSGVGVPIGYGQFNPQPASPIYSPAPGGPAAGGYSPGAGYEGQIGQRYPTPAAPRSAQRPNPYPTRNMAPQEGAAPTRIGSQPVRPGVGSINQRLRGPSFPQQGPTQQAGYVQPQGGRY